MKRFFAIFELTVGEQRLIIVLLLIFVVAVAVRKYREHATDQRAVEGIRSAVTQPWDAAVADKRRCPSLARSTAGSRHLEIENTDAIT